MELLRVTQERYVATPFLHTRKGSIPSILLAFVENSTQPFQRVGNHHQPIEAIRRLILSVKVEGIIIQESKQAHRLAAVCWLLFPLVPFLMIGGRGHKDGGASNPWRRLWSRDIHSGSDSRYKSLLNGYSGYETL